MMIGAPLTPSRDEARELLEQELAKPEYQREFSGPIRDAISAIIDWIGQRALNVGGLHIPYGPIIVVLILLVAIILCVIYVRPRVQRTKAHDETLDIDRFTTSDELRGAAANNANIGHYDKAFQNLFRAVVRAAEEREILAPQIGRTATEAARALHQSFPEHGDSITRCADLFNSSHYGGRSVTSTEYDYLVTLDRTLSTTEPVPSQFVPAGPVVPT